MHEILYLLNRGIIHLIDANSLYSVIKSFFPFSLYDGRVLCELMNEIEEGAIPQEVSQTVQEIFKNPVQNLCKYFCR